MFYGVVPYLRTYSIDLKPTMKFHLRFQKTFVDNESWLWKVFKGLQSILHNLTSKGVTVPLKYTQPYWTYLNTLNLVWIQMRLKCVVNKEKSPVRIHIFYLIFNYLIMI
jgi:hypothetical protein